MKSATINPNGPSANKIGVKLATKRKFDRIAKIKRWTLVQAADAAADHFLDSLRPPTTGTGNQPVTASDARNGVVATG